MRGSSVRSGPPADPRSGRSERRGLAFTELPASGYDGDIPDFPLPRPLKRERELWTWAWRTPQAAAWAREPWRQHSVSMWVRTAARCESRDATAADKNSLHRFAEDIGLSPAGMKFNGWTVAAPVQPEHDDAARQGQSSARDRFEVIDGGA